MSTQTNQSGNDQPAEDVEAETSRNEAAEPSKRKPRKGKKPRKKVNREIRKLRTTVKLCIPKLPFSRLVRDIQMRKSNNTKFWQSSAIACLHEAAEAFLVQFFEDAYTISQVAKRVTLMPRDMHCAEMIYSRNGLIRGQNSWWCHISFDDLTELMLRKLLNFNGFETL